MAEDPRIETREAQPYAAIAASVAMDALGSVLPELWPETFQWLAARSLAPAGVPFIRYVNIDMPNLEIEVGIPTQTLVAGDDRVLCGELPAGRYAVATHVGPYDGLLEANVALQAWAAANDVELDGDDNAGWAARLEIYATDPGSEPDPSKWQTRVEYKLR